MDPLSLVPANEPKMLGPLCQQCGLHQNCKNPIVREVFDPRPLPQGLPRVLFVVERPLAEDDRTGQLLSDMRTADFTDYAIVGDLQAEVRYTSLVRCWPGLKPGKGTDDHPKVAHIRACTSTFLTNTINEFKPQVIVALGDAALKALWPADQGTCPSVTKARSFPVKYASGTWLVCSYDPMGHFVWVESNGRQGRSLQEEYIRLMQLVSELITGEWAPTATVYKDIRTQEDMNWLLSRWMTYPTDWPVCPDTEVDVYISKNGQSIKLYEHGECEEATGYTLPDKKSAWHPDAQLLMLGLSIEVLQPDGTFVLERYVIHPDLITSDEQGNWNPNLANLLRGRWLIPYNGKSDFVDLYVFCGFYVYDPIWGIKAPRFSWSTIDRKFDDGFYMRYLRDTSLMDNSLKTTAFQELSIPAWDIRIYQEMEAQKSLRQKRGIPSYICMGDCQYNTLAEYNAGDTGNGLDVGLHLLEQLNFSTLAYEWMVFITEYFIDLEIEGLAFHFEKLCATIDRKEAEEEDALQYIRQHPATKAAEHETMSPFNIRSNVFYECLLGHIHNLPRNPPTPDRPGYIRKSAPKKGFALGEFIFPETKEFPRTETGKISSDKHVIAMMAGDLLASAGRLLEVGKDKTPEQLFWTAVRNWKRLGDDLSKFRGYLEYCVDDGDGEGVYRIHPTFRLGKTEKGDEDIDNVQGGTKSTRSSTQPNTQNFKDDDDFHELIVVPPPFYIGTGLKRWKLTIIDYDRIELVWIGWNCQDQLYMDWARQGLDQHVMNGAKLFVFKTGRPESEFWAYKTLEEIQNDPKHEVAKEQKPWRDDGKTGNFAVGYLQEPETTADLTGQPVEAIIALYKTLDEMHPGVVKKKYELYETLQRGQMVESYLLRNRRSAIGWEFSSMPPEVFFSWDTDTRRKRNPRNLKQFRSLWNSVAGQTDAYHCTAIMHSRLWVEEIKSGRSGLNQDWVRPCNHVHDAGWYYIVEDYLDTALNYMVPYLKDVTKLPRPFGLPLGVSVEIGDSYKDKEKYIVGS